MQHVMHKIFAFYTQNHMYLVRSEKNQRIKVKFQGRVYVTLGFGNGTPKSVSYRYICLTW